VAIPLSVLDLVPILRDRTAAEALAASVELARAAESHGYERVWYAEHHNSPAIASAATAVIIAHVAANTSTIRVGAGGIMLPNHSPLVIAEQFGTLAELHPGRIELGLGRAPGTDRRTVLALRRDPLTAADTFPEDVVELQAYLGDPMSVPGITAVPGRGTHVPLYLLGSSLFGAQLAATLGLPYGFASHFAPAALQQAVAVYRREFRPSAQLDAPRVLAAVNVVLADTSEEAAAAFHKVLVNRVATFAARAGQPLDDAEAEAVLASPSGRQIADMLAYTAVGTAAEVRTYLERFAKHADADELVLVHQATGYDQRLRSLIRTAEVMAEPDGNRTGSPDDELE
jgi:luciferase family oxidoreductase group 1